MMKKNRILIIGGGSIGKRHLKNFLSLKQDCAVCETDVKRAEEIRRKYSVIVYGDPNEALRGQKYDAAVIATPNRYHLTDAIRAAKKGLNLLIEKPVSHETRGIDKLIKISEKNKCGILVGYNWKFHPSFKRIKGLLDSGAIGKVLSFNVISGQYLPDWHPWEDYRKGYSANKRLGGGILLDSHELAYIKWFMGGIKSLVCVNGKYSSLDIDTEDIAELILNMKSGAVGTLHVDYVQHPYRRSYYIYGEKGTVEWDFSQRRISVYKYKTKKWEHIKEPGKYDLNRMYVEEARHFIDVIGKGKKPATGIEEGRELVRIIEKAKKSKGRTVKL
ncbi:MAG: Gfo/Idh/MocA family oxidoreductase [Endomicrobiales bacterium]|nr:Gfo/Idh/MocA family oxidoreductase [Endomicrobiales bacterium]